MTNRSIELAIAALEAEQAATHANAEMFHSACLRTIREAHASALAALSIAAIALVVAVIALLCAVTP